MDASIRLKTAFIDHLRNDIKSVERQIKWHNNSNDNKNHRMHCHLLHFIHYIYIYIFIYIKQILCTITSFVQCWLLIRHYQEKKRRDKLDYDVTCTHIHPPEDQCFLILCHQKKLLNIQRKNLHPIFTIYRVQFVLILILTEGKKYQNQQQQ